MADYEPPSNKGFFIGLGIAVALLITVLTIIVTMIL